VLLVLLLDEPHAATPIAAATTAPVRATLTALGLFERILIR
jgi:hypothetical protein